MAATGATRRRDLRPLLLVLGYVVYLAIGVVMAVKR